MSVRTTKKGILFLDFYCPMPNGEQVRCRETLNCPDTPANRKRAEAQDKTIAYALNNNRFNYLEHFPSGTKAHIFREALGEITLDNFWPKWMDRKRAQDIRRNTERNWQGGYDLHIGPRIGHLLLSQIKDDQLFELRFALTNLRDKDGNRQLANSTINDKIIKPLCMCLKYAYDKKLIEAYPCYGIGRLKEIPPEIFPLSFEELHHFLDFLQEKYPDEHDLYYIWSRQGFRPGEICALKWDKIDYFNRKTLVRETLHEDGSVGPPKTESSVRDVDIATEAVEQAYKRQEARTGLMNSYVFMTSKQHPYTAAYLRKRFKFLLRRAGLRIRAPKQMRHTFATLNIGSGENPTWVSNQLGHADCVITLKVYNRFIPNLTGRDGSAFEKVYNSWATDAHPEGKTGQNRAISRQRKNKKQGNTAS